MKLFDDLIAETERILAPLTPKTRSASEITPWRDAGENELVLFKESAFELGAGGSGCGACLVTGDRSLVGDGCVDVYGGDLPDIRGDAPYARIAIVYAEGMDESDDAAYKSVQRVDFVKYHVFPEGFMLRISSEGSKEQVRVSKRALKQGINFAAVGGLYAAKYLENPAVKAVKTVFVTVPEAVSALKKVAEEAKRRTAALNKILQSVMLDCSVCALKPVCDEVEELKELHFGRSAAASGQGEKK